MWGLRYAHLMICSNLFLNQRKCDVCHVVFFGVGLFGCLIYVFHTHWHFRINGLLISFITSSSSASDDIFYRQKWHVFSHLSVFYLFVKLHDYESFFTCNMLLNLFFIVYVLNGTHSINYHFFWQKIWQLSNWINNMHCKYQ